MKPVRARFAGSGIAVPPRIIDNPTIARVLETDDAWVRERSGVVERRLAILGWQGAEGFVQAALEAHERQWLERCRAIDLVQPPDVGQRVEQEMGLDLRLRCLQPGLVEAALEVDCA